MRAYNKILSLVLLLSTRSSAQEISYSNKQTGSQFTMDEGEENQIAKLFEASRANAKVPRLVRIRPPDSLKQTVCSIALTDKVPNILWFPTNRMSAFYKTARPETVSVELNKISSLQETHSPRPARYSVVVWRVNNEKGESTYWVGVQLYVSIGWQFFADHFTDDVEYRNYWKKGVAPECRQK